MAQKIQVRRGLDANRTNITPSVGEIIYTTDTKKLYVGDGSTPGGNIVRAAADLFGQNVGTAGISVFKTKDGDTLQFRTIDSGSSKIAVTLDSVNEEVVIDLNEGAISYNNIADTPTLATVATTGSYNDLTDKPTIDGGSSTLAELTDTTITTPASGQVLKHNGSSWVNTSVDYSEISNKPTLFSGDYNDLTNQPSIPATTGDLNDVVLDTLQSGQVMKHNGAGFVNSFVDYSEITSKPTLFSGDYTDLTNKPTIPANINDLGDVDTSGLTANQVLKYNGSTWVASDDITAEFQNNYSATTAPTATDDSAAGYSVGSVWIDTTGNESYRCVDNTSTAAVWIKTSLTSDELATVAVSGDYNDLTNKPVFTTELSEDTTPQLGGDLDVTGHKIVNTDANGILQFDTQYDGGTGTFSTVKFVYNDGTTPVDLWTMQYDGTDVAIGSSSGSFRFTNVIKSATINQISTTRVNYGAETHLANTGVSFGSGATDLSIYEDAGVINLGRNDRSGNVALATKTISITDTSAGGIQFPNGQWMIGTDTYPLGVYNADVSLATLRVADPVDADHAASKNYVDTGFQAINKATVSTSDATPTNIAAITINNGIMVKAKIMGKDTAGKYYLAEIIGGAGSTGIIGAPQATQTYDTEMAGCSVDFTYGTSVMNIEVTGIAATAIDWKVEYEVMEGI